MSSEDASEEWVRTVTVGGSRSGREMKCWNSLALGAGGGGGGVSRERLAVSTSATVNCHEIGVGPLAVRTRALTVTVSPCWKGRSGTKLAPSPCE